MASFYRLLPLEEIFAVYESISPTARARGNVHGFTIEAIMATPGTPAALDGIRILNVLRHPISYIDSHTALVLKASAYPDLRQDYERQFSETVIEIPELHLVDCPDFELFFAFAVSCKSAANLEKDFAHAGFEHRRMESLTTDLGVLKQFCEFLTGLEYDEKPLIGMIEQGAINRHRPAGSSNHPAHVFGRWQLWQQDMARAIIPGSLLRQLEQCGYDVDLLRGAGKPTSAAPRMPAGPPRCLGDYLLTLSRDTWPGKLRPARNVDHAPVSRPPELVQEGLHGFNLVAYAGKYYALAQSLGPFDLPSAEDAVVEAHLKDGNCIIADSLDRLRGLVPAPEN